jgi:LytS/YehU family sensor histidine kinase
MRELELTVIRTQMNPHFMYNCLNSIQNLVQKNQNEQAHLYLSKFASLVRQVLNNSKKEEIPLSKELDSVQEYIELEQLRFDFGFKLEVAEGVDLNAIFVPPHVAATLCGERHPAWTSPEEKRSVTCDPHRKRAC